MLVRNFPAEGSKPVRTVMTAVESVWSSGENATGPAETSRRPAESISQARTDPLPARQGTLGNDTTRTTEASSGTRVEESRPKPGLSSRVGGLPGGSSATLEQTPLG